MKRAMKRAMPNHTNAWNSMHFNGSGVAAPPPHRPNVLEWGGGGGCPPSHTYKIKENQWVFIVFGMGWGAGCSPPHPQNQRKPSDFHSFWSGVGGGGCPPHPQNQRKPMDFHSFWNGVGGRVPPPTHKMEENLWILKFLE